MRTHNGTLLLILLLALLLRLLLWGQPLHQPANDEIEYIAVARDLLAGRGWQFYESFHWLRAPLYPLFLAGSLWLAGGDLHRATLPNIALSVANVYLLYRLAQKLVGQQAALLAALLAAGLCTFATFGSLYMPETLFTFLFTAALACLLQATTTDHGSMYGGPSVAAPTTDDAEDKRQETRDRRQETGELKTISSPLHPLTRSPAHPLISLALAGVLFGLATLTRSITLFFLPIVALWLFFWLRATTDHRAGVQLNAPTAGPFVAAPRYQILLPLVFLLCAVLTIAPWTTRNYLAYGRLIPVETGLSFNLWFFLDPHESNRQIYQTLRSIPNPATRADYATAKGLERLRAEPDILLRNIWPNLARLLEADTIEDRFILASYYSDVGLPLFAAALVFDDALYMLILLASAAGIVLRWPRGVAGRPLARLSDPWWLALAWVLYVLVTVLLTHGEARYRHFLHPVLIPFAAWTLMREFRHVPQRPAFSPNLLLVGVLWAVILGIMLGIYPWAWAEQNLGRGWHVVRGDIAWGIGQPAAARRAYERATEVHETPDGWLRRGDAARAQGDHATALSDYRQAMRLAPPYIPASARLGDLLRETGDMDRAYEAFEGEFADQQQMVDWAWRHLRPIPINALDVGDGLDFGYIGGVYPAETIEGETARWTNGRATLRLGGGVDSQAGARLVLVRLMLAAPQPNGAAVRTQVCVSGSCWPLAVAPGWRFYTLPFAARPGTPLNIDIISDTFQSHQGSPSSDNGERTLGVLIGRAAITQMPSARAPD